MDLGPENQMSLSDGEDFPNVSQKETYFDAAHGHDISAQSQVLTNLDLLELIFTFFDIYPTENNFNRLVLEREERQHLLWASITCRAFFEPAMSLLWRSMNSLWPLVRFIPVLIEVNDPSTYPREIIQRELRRFEFYAKRIRHLQFFGSTYILPINIFPSIMEFRQSKILPALQTLLIPRLADITSKNRTILFQLAGPSLHQVSISGINTQAIERHAAKLLKTVCKGAKALRGIKLEGRLSPISLDIIPEFGYLQNLHITLRSAVGSTAPTQLFPATFLGDMCEIGTLKRLTLVFDAMVQFNRPDGSNPRPKGRRQRINHVLEDKNTMKSLNVLEIVGSATIVNDILGSIKTPNLKEITMNLLITGHSDDGSLMVPSPTLLEGLIKMLAEGVEDCLESIRINSFSREVQMPHQALKWFRHFNRLEHMQTSIDVVSKDTIPSMFASGIWTSLRTFRLEAGTHVVSFRKVVSSLSLSQLAIFARFCPALTKLSVSAWIFLTREDIRSMREEIKNDCLCHKLHELELLPFIDMTSYSSSGTALAPSYGGRIQDVLTTSRFIDHIFPSLARLELSQLYVVDSEWCDDISATVKEFQEVRRDRHTCSR